MKRLLTAALTIWSTFAAPVWADDNPVVVELFTSQGCSSCPPADALMHELAKRADVVALALHVDYWDYIGWKDEYARPAHTQRQKAYAQVAGRRSVYTPQMVINGMDDVVGARSAQLAALIDRHKAQRDMVSLSAVKTGDDIRISASWLDQGRPAPMIVQLVHYQNERHANITRGENAGKKVAYRNVVDSWTLLGEWDGAADLSMTARVQSDYPAVVLIQQARTGPIVAAIKLD